MTKPRGRLAALFPLVFAAHVPAAVEATLEEVEVTARRVAEDAARVPLAIDVAADESLGAGAVNDLDSLASRFPGLAFESLWGGQGAAVVLRGLSQPSTAGDNVGVFVDDVYQAGRASMDVDMLDLDRVEVVRGPQNTLLGRSTFAGAVRMVPAEPNAAAFRRLQAELGTGSLAGLEGAWSQPVGKNWRARAAASIRSSNGAYPFQVDRGVGDARQRSTALTLARREDAEPDRYLSLHVRLGDSRNGHPASNTLDAEDLNCGARDSRSGFWSYYCGAIPLSQPFTLTPHLPDSRTWTTQSALRLQLPAGAFIVSALASFYHAEATSIRDFDGSAQGFWSGVCTVGDNCTAGANLPVTRFVFPNVVSSQRQRVSDWSHELRLSGGNPEGASWMIGMAGSLTRSLESTLFGADRGDLLPTERLTSIIAANPAVVGPASQLNRALVDDSRLEQVPASQSRLRRHGLGVFGTLEAPLTPRIRSRLELRADHETVRVDPHIAAFLPNEDPDPPPGRFWAVTPRFALEFKPSARWYSYASVARGARSGGVNTLPGLDAEERSFGPEYNWTSELGMRFASATVLQELHLTAYHVDWRDTQIMGIANTPGVSALITRNTGGVIARGLEARLQLRAGRLLGATLSGSIADTSFRKGSDDAGSRPICGLTVMPPSSDFCAFGPPRSGNGSLALVPYLDGNRTARSPRHSWNAVLELLPHGLGAGWSLSGHAMLAYRGNVMERPVNGARYGERTVLNARLAVASRKWEVALWGTNLTNESYFRVAGSRGAAFYPQLPRPIDLLQGEGRRAGLSVTFQTGG